MDEYKLVAERERAHLAQQIENNPVWQEAWEGFAKNLRGHMEAPESTDEVVLAARQGLLMMKRVRDHIEKAMQTGKMAAFEMERSKDGRSNTGSSQH